MRRSLQCWWFLRPETEAPARGHCRKSFCTALLIVHIVPEGYGVSGIPRRVRVATTICRQNKKSVEPPVPPKLLSARAEAQAALWLTEPAHNRMKTAVTLQAACLYRDATTHADTRHNACEETNQLCHRHLGGSAYVRFYAVVVTESKGGRREDIWRLSIASSSGFALCPCRQLNCLTMFLCG